ncbi:ubiquinol-cytochrome-c reductase complex assembly factor 3 [Pelodytes ibericus]
MEIVRRVAISALAIAACTGVGGILFAVVTSGEQTNAVSHRVISKTNPAVLAEVRENNKLAFQVLKQAAETNENIASKPFSKR